MNDITELHDLAQKVTEKLSQAVASDQGIRQENESLWNYIELLLPYAENEIKKEALNDHMLHAKIDALQSMLRFRGYEKGLRPRKCNLCHGTGKAGTLPNGGYYPCPRCQ